MTKLKQDIELWLCQCEFCQSGGNPVYVLDDDCRVTVCANALRDLWVFPRSHTIWLRITSEPQGGSSYPIRGNRAGRRRHCDFSVLYAGGLSWTLGTQTMRFLQQILGRRTLAYVSLYYKTRK